MNWVHAALPLAVTVGILAVLGAPIALALRTRGFSSVAVTVAAAFAVLAIAPILAGASGLARWSLPVAFAVSLIAAVLCLALWRWTGPKHSPRIRGALARSQRPWMPLIGAGLGGFVILATFVRRMWAPDAISQTYDANFHLNLVAQMLDSGNASPLAVDLSSPGNPSFYPAAWHATVTLVAQLTGASVPLATNALLLVCVSVVWPIGVVALARALFGPSTRVSLIAGLTAALIPSVPYTLGAYGVLYPTLLATALLPYAAAATLKVLRIGRARATDPLRSVSEWIYLLGTIGAIGLAQPAGLHALAVFVTPAVFAAGVPAVRRSTGAGRAARAAGLAVVAVAVIALWIVAQTSDNEWRVRRDFFSAAWDALSGGPRLGGEALILLALAVVASVLCVRAKRLRWLTVSWLIAVALYAVADGLPVPMLRTALTGPWYNDSWRLAAVAMTLILPLVIYALSALVVWLRFATRRSALRVRIGRPAVNAAPARRPRSLVGPLSGRHLAVPAALLALFVALQSPSLSFVAGYIQGKYEPRAERAPLLDEDERALIDRLPEQVPQDAVIINNPWNGGALAEALADRAVLFPHTGGTYPEERYEIADGIAEGDAAACRLADELNARYVLDFGKRLVFKNTPRAEPFENITNIRTYRAPALTEVDREGEAVLYEVTGC